MAACRPSLWISVLLLLTVVASRCEARTLRQKRSLALKHVKTWPNGVVPYIIKTASANSSESEDAFSEVDRLLIRKAMDTIEQETCVKFKQIEEGSNKKKSPYVEISGRNDKHCYATLGMITEGKNEIILNSLCRTVGQILHELAHTLGLLHEIMRPDRNDYIVLHEENIAKHYKQEFDVQPALYTHLWDRTFDFQSITLYDPFSFTMSSKPVWEPRKHLKNTPLFPLREKDLSFEDTAAINRLYNCAVNCTQRKRKCNLNAFLTARCRCETAESYAYRRCRDDRAYRGFCSNAIEKNKCYDNATVAIPFCRKTCGRCFRAGIFGKSSPPMKRCVDLEPRQCPRLIKEGYCYFDAWTKIHCQQSCGLCPPPDVAKRQTYSLDAREYLLAYQTGECYNRFDDLKCMIFAESGHCEKNPSFMTSYCALSCGNCRKENSLDLSYLHIAQTGCRNLIDDERCNALAREHKCRGITLKQCMLSCGVCRDGSPRPTTSRQPTTTPAAKVRRQCKDKSTMCPWLVEHGHCLTKPEQMEQLCPLSCKFCLEDCVDLDPAHICADVKKRGYCIYDPSHASRCAKSCGLCKTQQPDASSSKRGEDIGDNEGTKSEVIEKVDEPCTETDASKYSPAKVEESTLKKKMHRK
ncbi:Astacin-like metalloprotease toxin 2 [Clonorchis sinensis]|uniref:Metalloendopeptidase n=1 Tax=Clonorchis sinensis TaxID=79923 RepID=A0A8T1MPC1_CLOSI|nr:Astacin-like metalloprotease toxin 2 [Clonorchis sinensis]